MGPTDQPCISLLVDARPDNTGRPHWGPIVRKELGERARSFAERTAAREAYDADAKRISAWLDGGPRPSAHGLAVFACAAADLFEGVEHLARLYVVALGAIQARVEVESAKVSRSAAGGWSQARYQRHVENFIAITSRKGLS